METARKQVTYAMHFSYSLMTAGTANTELSFRGWNLSVALQLGRVSNLPTVWTNTLAAIVLSGASTSALNLTLLLAAMSFAYIGGMYLNDAFDRKIDAAERPERPIPSKQVSATDVFVAGFAMLGISTMLVGLVASSANTTGPALLSAVALNIAIVGYNVWHKGNPASPLLMGLCRLLVYVTCALSITAEPDKAVFIGAMITLAYLIGLTYTAKQEQLGHVSTLWPLLFLAAPLVFGVINSNVSLITAAISALLLVWIGYCLKLIFRRQAGDIPRAVVSLIAGISLVDGVLIAVAASAAYSLTLSLMLTIATIGAFALTLKLQRYISGT